jgi:5-methylcytosine-specific restriction endonuclease McrA
MKNEVPELWRQRAKAGLCPVCGKTPQEFDKGLKVYCSVKCRDEYASKFTYWSSVREKFLREHGEFCDKCNITREKYNKKRGVLLDELRKQWLGNPQNKMMLDERRDELLVEWSKDWEDRYKRIMDDHWLIDNSFCDYDREMRKELPDSIYFEVDHKTALVNGGDMWDVSNLQVLCGDCHKKKTILDLNDMKRNRRKTVSILDEGEKS